MRHKLDSLGIKIPSHLVCPITLELMNDPVVTCDGHCYERLAIELWSTSASRGALWEGTGSMAGIAPSLAQAGRAPVPPRAPHASTRDHG